MSEPSEIDEILERAGARARENNLPYRGAVTPAEAYALMQAGRARLVDVRTRFENEYVGRVPDTALVEWKALGAPGPNPDFLGQLAQVAGRQDNILFLCRSGGRSHSAAVAATQAGYSAAFNILEGFEGDLDAEKHRGSKGGWRKAGLPWIQG